MVLGVPILKPFKVYPDKPSKHFYVPKIFWTTLTLTKMQAATGYIS